MSGGRRVDKKWHNANASPWVDECAPFPYAAFCLWNETGVQVMKVINSLKSAKKRDRFCRVVRRRGRTYIINKRNRRFKARQG